MSVLQNVIEAPLHVKKVPKKKAVAQAKELLKMVGLEGREDAIYIMTAKPAGVLGINRGTLKAAEFKYATLISMVVHLKKHCYIYEKESNINHIEMIFLQILCKMEYRFCNVLRNKYNGKKCVKSI